MERDCGLKFVQSICFAFRKGCEESQKRGFFVDDEVFYAKSGFPQFGGRVTRLEDGKATLTLKSGGKTEQVTAPTESLCIVGLFDELLRQNLINRRKTD